MDIIKKIGEWAGALSNTGMMLIALGIVIQVLFAGVPVPFVGDLHVIDNIMAILGGLSNEGLLGLVGAFIIYHLLKK
jgi:hypothetical protein